MQPARNPASDPGDHTYLVELTCPVCLLAGSQRVLRGRRSLVLPVHGHPFLRAFSWSEGCSRTEDSPLFYGLCLCPRCRYPGLEADFRGSSANTQVNRRSLRRLFVEENVGFKGSVAGLLTPFPGRPAEPERSIRLTLASIRAETLLYPEFWRRLPLGRLYLHLYWIFFDEGHFNWEDTRPLTAPTPVERGPKWDRLQSILGSLEEFRESWSEIPLDPSVALAQAVRFHREAYELRSGELEPEEAVLEERQLGQLFGLVGEMDQARDMYDRARASSLRLKAEAIRKREEAFKEAILSLPERRALTNLIPRLGRLSEEISEERQAIFGPDPRPSSLPKTATSGASRRTPTPAAPKVNSKRRFGIFG